MPNDLNTEDKSGCFDGMRNDPTFANKVDYKKNLYTWSDAEIGLQGAEDYLAPVDVLLNNALTFYGDGENEGLRIAYISDIHLHHHLKRYYDNEEKMIKDVVRKLLRSLEHLNGTSFNKIYAIFLGGDISESPDMTLKFLEKLRITINIPVFFVLGNHEYIKFPDVQSCVTFYRSRLQELQITLLHNEYVDCTHYDEKFMIFGGTGFAKYDESWNADNIICCANFTREDEIRETALFEEAYRSALNISRKKKRCLLCLSHYPVSACLNNVFEKEVIYFSGHNHQNNYIREENKVLYADNQIGYENNNIAFKEATTGLMPNPYSGLDDGMYQTSVEDYLKFYRYLGEYVGDGNLLYRRCRVATLYVVKRRGYYGFFIISTQNKSKGISIVNGGKTKKLTTSTEISWICENFDIVISKYIKMLLPLRKAQEELSRELKELGFDGTIHGLIVDIDYYHHIALNPIDGTMNVYYSSSFGSKRDLNSFNEVLKSIENFNLGFTKESLMLIQEKYEKKIVDGEYLLRKAFRKNLLEIEGYKIEDSSNPIEQVVSLKEGMYGLSRKISPLQRLFTGHVLRDFDLRLTETVQTAHRKKLYEGRVFRYQGVRYQIIEDKGRDIVIAEELQKGSRSKGKGLRLSGQKRTFAIEDLKRKIENRKNFNTYWID